RPKQDYSINVPATKKTGYSLLAGGRNIVLIGGHVTTPTGYTHNRERRAIYIKEASGIVHSKGVRIGNSGGGEHDAIAIDAPEAIVKIQHGRVEDSIGAFGSEHSDFIQPWGGVEELRVDYFTGSTNYQGFYLVQTQAQGFIGDVI